MFVVGVHYCVQLFVELHFFWRSNWKANYGKIDLTGRGIGKLTMRRPTFVQPPSPPQLDASVPEA